MVAIKLPTTRGTSREGVNAAQSFFDSNGCVFQEVAQQNDFGKDAYVDVGQNAILTYLCVSLQIKSGASFRTKYGDYFIPVENHADTWRRSTVPVFGLVYDPADRLLRWVDLTGYLRAHPDLEGGSVPVSRDALLTESTLRNEFSLAISTYAAGSGGTVALNLLSASALQGDAVFDAWALGRHDARYLVLLRRVILELDVQATRKAIAALAHAAPHPDIFWTKDNWIPREIEEQVRPSFRWSPEEIAHMIRTIDPEDWGRGTLGQSFDVLMYEDPNVVAKLRASVGVLLGSEADATIVVRAASVALAHSRNARHELSLLIDEYPALTDDEWFQGIAATVREFGGFSLY